MAEPATSIEADLGSRKLEMIKQRIKRLEECWNTIQELKEVIRRSAPPKV